MLSRDACQGSAWEAQAATDLHELLAALRSLPLPPALQSTNLERLEYLCNTTYLLPTEQPAEVQDELSNQNVGNGLPGTSQASSSVCWSFVACKHSAFYKPYSLNQGLCSI